MINLSLRKFVVALFVLTYLLFGAPLWYWLTNIYRAPLPIDYITSLSQNSLQDVKLVIPLYVKDQVGQYSSFSKDLDKLLNEKIASQNFIVDWSIKIQDFNDEVAKQVEQNTELYHILQLESGPALKFDVEFDSTRSIATYDKENVDYKQLLSYVSEQVLQKQFDFDWKTFSKSIDGNFDDNNNIAISYRPNIHLSILLLIGDGTPVSWGIEEATRQYITPLRRFLAPVYNFTVDTEIVYYDDLNLNQLNNLNGTVTADDISYTIDISEITAVDSYDESVGINLAIIFPSEINTPTGLNFINGTKISIDDEELEINWNSYILPQWGMLAVNKYPLKPNSILDDSYLKPIMHKFSGGALKLLGLINEDSDALETPYNNLNSFKRISVIKNLHSSAKTLESLVRLTEKFQQMAIPKEVLANVKKAIEIREELIQLVKNSKLEGNYIWDKALLLSNKLVEVCEQAFFEGEMVQQNFFPDEHKMAVYFPLIGPITMVLFLGIVNSFKEQGKADLVKKPEEKEEKSAQDGQKMNAE